MNTDYTNKEKIPENFFYNKFGKDKPKFSIERPRKLWLYFGALLAIIFCYWLTVSAPANFPVGKVISIPSGASLKSVGIILLRENMIRSSAIFGLSVRFFAGDKGVKAGEYIFEDSQNVFTVAKRLIDGERGFAPVSIVVPEGSSIKDISKIISDKLPSFDKQGFLKISSKYEGYLFPDTYHIMFDAKPQDVLDIFLENFDKKIEPLLTDIEKFKWSLVDVIKMASIVEEEGRTFETRRMIAGILWKRISIGMPLQVDASFLYVNGKKTFELTTDDLTVDSPYNTYTRKGLPPTPISNPGLDSIKATINPIASPYLYYLTDREGKMHYAKTHEEHLLNKEKYLR